MTRVSVRPENRTPIVLLTMQRTGSGWVTDRINNFAIFSGYSPPVRAPA